MTTTPAQWLVLNQSHNALFVDLLAGLSAQLGPCLLLSGVESSCAKDLLSIQHAAPYVRGDIKARATSWARFAAQASRVLATAPGRPAVLAVTNPPMLPHLAWTFGKLRGLRYGLLVWDIYPDHIVHMGWSHQHSALVRGWQRLNQRALGDASVVITLGQRMAENLIEQGARRERVRVIPSWADTEHIKPLPRAQNLFALEHKLVDKFVVLYSGNLGATHGLGGLLDAAAMMQGEERVRFVIIGDGLGRPVLEEQVRARSLHNVQLVERQTWARLPQALAAADLSVVAQAPGTEHLSVPSKTYSYLAAGTALLALTSTASDLADLVQQNEVGEVAAHDDGARATEIIRRYQANPALLADTKTRARQLAETEHSPAMAQARFLQALSPLFCATTK